MTSLDPPTTSVHWSQVRYAVKFVETGLPKSNRWYVNITGQSSVTSTSNSTTANLPNGTFSYTVTTTDPLYAPAYAPTFTVNARNTSVSLRFGFGYHATFSESGLTAGVAWFVNFTGGGPLLNGTGGSLTTFLPNGTYPLTVASADKHLAPTYVPQLSVAGGTVGASVGFSVVAYAVTFPSGELPTTDTWYLNLTGYQCSPCDLSAAGSTSITPNLGNGTYGVSVATNDKRYAPAHPTGLTVNGAPMAVNVSFALVTYAVTFTESGLSSATNWSITVGTVSGWSKGTSIVLPLSNGTLSYSATVSTGGTSVGTLTVSGSAVKVTLAFHKVTFTVSGLPAGTSWQLTINGATATTTAKSIVLYLAAGTYTYTATVTPSGRATGTFTQNGAALTVALTFYKITFTQSGLPTGTTWQVTSNGATGNSTGKSIVLYLVNGNYTYSIGLVSGYRTTDSGTDVVNGASYTIHSIFQKTTYTVKFTESGLASGTDWCVTFNSVNSCSTTGSISFTGIVNGTSYGYTIGQVPNYTLTGSYTGTITVAGGGQGTITNTVKLSWTLDKDKPTFSEKDLSANSR